MALGITLTALGGPTVLLEVGGVRLLVDPTFDEPGEYPIGSRALRETAPTALSAAEVGRVDAVLLSHDQHPDNLDRGGREFLAGAPRTLSTASAAGRIEGVEALPNWASTDVGGVLVTGVPAQHGPDGTEHLTGEVTGFLLSGQDLPTVYVSGDNASLDVVARVRRPPRQPGSSTPHGSSSSTPTAGPTSPRRSTTSGPRSTGPA